MKTNDVFIPEQYKGQYVSYLSDVFLKNKRVRLVSLLMKRNGGESRESLSREIDRYVEQKYPDIFNIIFKS